MSAFVVFSPCRTGSTIIINNLLKDKKNTVVHTHDPTWRPQSEDFVCILSRREDPLAAVISQSVMEVTGEVHTYSNSITPFVVDLDRFYNLYLAHKIFYKKIVLDGYKQIIDIWYNRLVADPYYLFRELGQHQQTDYSTIPKSPYDYTKIITNYEQLQEAAKEVEQRFLQ